MVPMMFNCKANCQRAATIITNKRHEAQNACLPAKCRIKMKRWGTRPYSRSVHYTESILLVGHAKVKNICPRLNRFFAVFPHQPQKIPDLLTNPRHSCQNKPTRAWWNWQTRWIQVPMGDRAGSSPVARTKQITLDDTIRIIEGFFYYTIPISTPSGLKI